MIKNLIIATIIIAISTNALIAQSWNELGTGSNSLKPNGNIFTTCTDPSGNIYAAGGFKNTNGNYYVAKWNGTNWSELGTGSNSLNANSIIETLCSDGNGNIYAAGSFYNSNTKQYVAKWNGTSWSELGTGSNALNANGDIQCIFSDGASNIYAAGSFNSTDGYYVAKWNGTSWSALGTGTNALKVYNTIHSICKDNSGNIYAAGEFYNTNNKYYVAKWNGTNWSELGTLNANSSINDICSDPNGNIYAAGEFRNSNNKNYVAKWDGTTWQELGTGSSALNATSSILSLISDSQGNIYAAGNFINYSYYSRYVAKWNSTTWSEVGTGSNRLIGNDQINTLSIDKFGNLYAAGFFYNTSNYPYVAKYGNSVTDILTFEKNDFKFYPNPTKYDITIESEESGVVLIYNLLGEVLKIQPISKGKSKISLDGLGTGIYPIQIKSNDNNFTTVTKTIVVE